MVCYYVLLVVCNLRGLWCVVASGALFWGLFVCGLIVRFGVGYRLVFVGFAYVGFAGIFCCGWGSVVYVDTF